jgi:hypothetical protein
MKLRYALALICLVALSVFAQLPKPDPMLKSLEPWAHTYRCTGTDFLPKPHPTKTTVTGKWTLDGHWIAIHVAQEKTKDNPFPFSGDGTFGYDPGTKKYVADWVDNMGGYEPSTGTQTGNTFTLDGIYHGTPTGKARDVFTIKGNTMTHTFDMEDKGKWMKITDESCTKA